MRFFLSIAIFLFIGCNEPIVYPPGGYDYPKEVKGEDTNFYYLPIKEIESKTDSYRDSYDYILYTAFNEPNLSLRPLGIDKFRLTYISSFDGIFIISLENKQIIVKRITKNYTGGIYEIDPDLKELNEVEKKHYQLLKQFYPLEDTAGLRPYTKHYLDSMSKRFPELLDQDYYKKLTDKNIVIDKTFSYDSLKINLSNREYHCLINEINESGYWSLPFEFEMSEDAPNNSYGSFYLEVNTKSKYKVVKFGNWDIDVPIAFKKACQRLVNLAGLNKEIGIYREDKSNN